MQQLQESKVFGAMHPGARLPGGALLGSAAVIVWNDVTLEGLDQFYEWHDKEHMPERLAIPGFRRGRRYAKPGHSPQWLTLYEAADLSVLVSGEYLERLNSPTPLTVSTLKHFRNTSRAVCNVVASFGSSSGGYVLALRVDVPVEHTKGFRELLTERLFPRVMASTGVLACHLYAADPKASFTDTAESRTRQFDVPAWIVLVESSRADAAERAHDLIASHELDEAGVAVRNDAAVYSLEICRLASERDTGKVNP